MGNLNKIKGLNLDQVCYLVNDHPSALPIFKSKPKSQANKLSVAKVRCPYSKNYLEDLYINQGKTRKALCDELGVTIGILNRWLSALEIRLPDSAYGGGLSRGRVHRLNPLGSAHRKRCQNIASTGGHFRDGYKMVFNPSHPMTNSGGYIAEHRQVVERQIHRFLTKDEDVHHINMDRSDNRPENLMMMSCSDHGKFHKFMEAYGAYALGAVADKPEPIAFSSPTFRNGEWLETLSVEKFIADNKSQNCKGNS